MITQREAAAAATPRRVQKVIRNWQTDSTAVAVAVAGIGANGKIIDLRDFNCRACLSVKRVEWRGEETR